jgi:probable F420-dependent oxidoreductase
MNGMGIARPFRFGVIMEGVHAAPAWTECARRAEALGYATLLIRDHFTPPFFGNQLAPVAALATAAAVTRTLRVGTLVLDNDYRHPVVLAKEAATLDLLSGGRLELGLGAGWLQSEYEQAGLPFDPPAVRVSRLAESIRVLKGLFADSPLTFAGEHYWVTGLDGYPKPLQRPRPPILLGAGSPRMLRLAGREADIVGLLTTSTRTGTLLDTPTERLADAVAQKIAHVREGAGERFAEVELSMVLTMVPTNDPPRAAAELIRQRDWAGITPDQVLAMPSVVFGPAERVADLLEARRARFGVSYYVVPDRLLEPFAPVVARLAGK